MLKIERKVKTVKKKEFPAQRPPVGLEEADRDLSATGRPTGPPPLPTAPSCHLSANWWPTATFRPVASRQVAVGHWEAGVIIFLKNFK